MKNENAFNHLLWQNYAKSLEKTNKKGQMSS